MTGTMPDIDLNGDLIQPEPVIMMDSRTNQLSINWNGDRPEDMIINAALLEGFIVERNALVAANRAQHAVLTKARLGQTINKTDWESVGLTSTPVRPVIDLKARQSNDTACACGASGIPLQHDTSNSNCLRHDVRSS